MTTNDVMPFYTYLLSSFNPLLPFQAQFLFLVWILAYGNTMIGQYRQLVHNAIAHIFGTKTIFTSFQFLSLSLLNAQLGQELVFDNESTACRYTFNAIFDIYPISKVGIQGGWQLIFGKTSGNYIQTRSIQQIQVLLDLPRSTPEYS